ncbi:MAG: hypothetical protein WBK28_00280 [Minisyncoccia bacterium]
MSKKEAKKVKSGGDLIEKRVAGVLPFETNTEFLTHISSNWEKLGNTMDSAQDIIKNYPDREHEGYAIFDSALAALSKDLEMIPVFYSSMCQTDSEEIESGEVKSFKFVPIS